MEQNIGCYETLGELNGESLDTFVLRELVMDLEYVEYNRKAFM